MIRIRLPQWFIREIRLCVLALLFFGPGLAVGQEKPPEQKPDPAAKQDDQKKPTDRDAEFQKKRDEMEAERKRKQAEADERLKKSMTAEQWEAFQRRREQMRKDFEQRRDQSKAEQQARAQAAEAERLRYRFAVDRTFAYHIEILIDGGEVCYRYVGNPVFTPKYVDKSGGRAELAAVGKLSYAIKVRGEKAFSEQPESPIWVGTQIVMDMAGRIVGGKADFFTKGGFLDTLFAAAPLKGLFFPELTEKAGERRSHSGSASAFLMTPGSFTGAFRTVDGTQKETLESELLSDGAVRVRIERSFSGKNASSPVEIRYESTGRFDRQRGLILECEGTFTSQIGAAKNPTAKITVTLLEGDALKQAFEQANKDWAQLPPSLDPIEFRRVRLEMEHPARLKSAADVKVGTIVAHFYNDNHWYLAKVSELGAKDYEVGIRLEGSNEKLTVHPGTLAIPPAEKIPKR